MRTSSVTQRWEAYPHAEFPSSPGRSLLNGLLLRSFSAGSPKLYIPTPGEGAVRRTDLNSNGAKECENGARVGLFPPVLAELWNLKNARVR